MTSPVSKYEITIKAEDLESKDVLSSSDPFCVVEIVNAEKQAVAVGMTAPIKNCNNPVFPESFLLPYMFETPDRVRIRLFDCDSSDLKDLRKHDYIGNVEFQIADLVVSVTGELSLPLRGPDGRPYRGKKSPKIHISGEPASSDNIFADMSFCAKNIDKKDTFGKTDGYLVFQRAKETASGVPEWHEVHKTEVVKKSLNPVWKPMKLSMQRLCNNDVERPIRIQCFDWDLASDDDFVGHADTCISELERLREAGDGVPLISEHKREKMKKKGKDYINSGMLYMLSFSITKIPTFLDYVYSGTMQLSLSVAIDFTGSNGHYSSPSSLHYIGRGQSEYEKAMAAVGSVLCPYDSDSLVDIDGFGAIVGGCVSHCFPLGGGSVKGVAGMLEAYRSTLTGGVQLCGPTVLHSVIEKSMKQAQFYHTLNTRSHAEQVASAFHQTGVAQGYQVLLILTDGQANDMEQIKSTVVAASSLPLSIIIVGVGRADFSAMEFLDSDGTMLRDSRGNSAIRDMVQFVPFNKFAGNPHLLAQETLAELPKQVLEYAKSVEMMPISRAEISMKLEAKAAVARAEAAMAHAKVQALGGSAP
ncbi:Copine-3 [Aduncisulcus paluster]|uniref:Copine-3 n=1 Tax=Aduncisulcus paluster TaxID=2918883 RepID=A0ABQ5KMD0_9EUKA|nr:Copine-3 [Aduncisulcus paluster]